MHAGQESARNPDSTCARGVPRETRCFAAPGLPRRRPARPSCWPVAHHPSPLLDRARVCRHDESAGTCRPWAVVVGGPVMLVCPFQSRAFHPNPALLCFVSTHHPDSSCLALSRSLHPSSSRCRRRRGSWQSSWCIPLPTADALDQACEQL
jgi:hypothetical protein